MMLHHVSLFSVAARKLRGIFFFFKGAQWLPLTLTISFFCPFPLFQSESFVPTLAFLANYLTWKLLKILFVNSRPKTKVTVSVFPSEAV